MKPVVVRVAHISNSCTDEQKTSQLSKKLKDIQIAVIVNYIDRLRNEYSRSISQIQSEYGEKLADAIQQLENLL